MASTEFPQALLEEIADRMANPPWYDWFLLRLDLAGYDSNDPETVRRAKRAAKAILMDRRFVHSVLGRLISTRMSNEELGRRIGDIPKSTVQAMAAGRVPERFTADQKKSLRALLVENVEILNECLDDLG